MLDMKEVIWNFEITFFKAELFVSGVGVEVEIDPVFDSDREII